MTRPDREKKGYPPGDHGAGDPSRPAAAAGADLPTRLPVLPGAIESIAVDINGVVLATLYFQRWEVETDFAHLKTTLGMDVLHCQTEAGVLKELTVYAIVYNLVRVVMLEASQRQGVPLNRISFVDTLRWLSSSPPNTPLPELVVNPDRPDRAEPRCKKRRDKNYPYMKHPRSVLRKHLLDQEVAA